MRGDNALVFANCYPFEYAPPQGPFLLPGERFVQGAEVCLNHLFCAAVIAFFGRAQLRLQFLITMSLVLRMHIPFLDAPLV